MRFRDNLSEIDKIYKMWIGIMVFDMYIWNVLIGLCG